MAEMKKTTLKHLKELHGNIIEISHLFNKISELAKSEGLKEISEYCRNSSKEEKKRASDLEALIHNLK
ncbi:MAG: hypothetical protein QXI33_02865 [Candidatus Pacearchaeota archaeon]